MIELDEDAKLCLKRAKLFEEMLASEAWKELAAIVKAQREMHLGNVLSAATGEIDGISHVLRTEFAKGVAFGLGIAVDTPNGVISTAKHIIAARGSVDVPQQEIGNGQRRSASDRNSDIERAELNLGPNAIVTDLG